MAGAMGSAAHVWGNKWVAVGSRCSWLHLGQSQQQLILAGNISTCDMLMPGIFRGAGGGSSLWAVSGQASTASSLSALAAATSAWHGWQPGWHPM